jgi:hypothetical protein
MTKEEANKILHSTDEEHVNNTLANAHSLWSEKIRTVDDAFNLAHAPDSMLANADGGDCKQSRWDAVQEAFLRFYISALKVSALYLLCS